MYALVMYKTGIFVLLKQCYYCANTDRMVNLTPPPPPAKLLGLNVLISKVHFFVNKTTLFHEDEKWAKM